ncbi:MAG: 2,3-bisphosphoglycerate-independent phosphoglycerate mutase [Methyloprofundus sp.]|nr:MAG: 2,3-bisphosphoglycerate-independent phosphoglycerate mutase [Methyloprofundus sp.]
MKPHPVLLIILDGFGLNPNRVHNGWAQAYTPHLDHYFATAPHTALQASGDAVGLPDGQFGNSEVGHLTLGAGRILEQDLERISKALTNREVMQHPAWIEVLPNARRIHLIGLVSNGGVHSHIDHLLHLLPLIKEMGAEPVIHVITDGRDTAPRSALNYIKQLECALAQLETGYIASVSGRYFAMDRIKNWERTQVAWNAMILGEGLHASSALEAVKSAYLRKENDEFIQPTVIDNPSAPLIQQEEPVLLFNFRSDRARQLATAISLEDFTEFDRKSTGTRRLLCMTQYDAKFPSVLFPPLHPKQVLAEVIANVGLKQFHCAETEKYPHVTYFFSGGREEPFSGEDRQIIPSPRVSTYDLEPEMSAESVADCVIQAVNKDKYHFVLVNFANGDMVGHTAKPNAILRAVETLDLQSHRIIQAALARNWRVLLTADHGNCDEMVDPETGQPHTRHTVYPVPFLLLGHPGAKLGIGRGLADVAPTILDLLEISKPEEMTGNSLLLKGSGS